MAAAPICMICNLERTLISIRPARNRHDMLQYECPNCRNVFRLVTRRAPLELDDVVFDGSALQTATQ
jgi:hypothetical protein